MTGGFTSLEPGAINLEALARDWVDICQSELTALAQDREVQEAWQAMLALWASAAHAMLRALPRASAHERPANSAHSARPPAPAATPDPRDATIKLLMQRIAGLEQRLAGVERHNDPSARGDG